MKQRPNPELGYHWKHLIWKYSSCLRRVWLRNEEFVLRLFFYRGTSCQNNDAIGKLHFWTKLNGNQRVDISQLKMAQSLPISTVQFWKQSEQLVIVHVSLLDNFTLALIISLETNN